MDRGCFYTSLRAINLNTSLKSSLLFNLFFYGFNCEAFGEKYWGETMRPLWRRMDEYRRALMKLSSIHVEFFKASHLATHINRAPKFKVVVLHRHLTHPLKRNIMEGLEIRRHDPEINYKEKLRGVLWLIGWLESWTLSIRSHSVVVSFRSIDRIDGVIICSTR